MKLSRTLPFAFAAAGCLAQDYFPLAAGNQWIFRSAGRFGQTLSVEVGEARQFDGAEYFAVTGLLRPGAVRWLRRADGGAIVEYLQDEKKTRAVLALGSPEGQPFEANVDECSRSATVRTRAAKLSLAAAGDFSNILEVKYGDSICADAGIDLDYFLPDIGLVKRVETSFAGPVVHELAYARVNGFITLAQPETGFSLSAPSPVASGARIFARLTVRNGAPSPLKLLFASGQKFNFELTEASTGRIVYNWAGDKLFTQATETVLVDREKNWAADFSTPQPLPPGAYILEGYLTTAATPQPYRARVALEVVAP